MYLNVILIYIAIILYYKKQQQKYSEIIVCRELIVDTNNNTESCGFQDRSRIDLLQSQMDHSAPVLNKSHRSAPNP